MVPSIRCIVSAHLSCVDCRQLVSVLGVLERYVLDWEDTDQGFIVRTLNKLHDKLGGLFHRFVEEQVRAIEDMKVTAKKRQGVLLMFKIFPVHSPQESFIDGRGLLNGLKYNSRRIISMLDWIYEILSTRCMRRLQRLCSIHFRLSQRITHLINNPVPKTMMTRNNLILTSV